jgi:hypothetical protein
VSDPDQQDSDGDGVGDACQASSPDDGEMMPDDLGMPDLAGLDLGGADLSMTDLSTPPDLANVDMSGVVLVGKSSLSSPDQQLSGIVEAHQFTAAQTGTARNLWMYIDSDATADQLQMGIYSDQANYPNTLLATTAIFGPLTFGAWNHAAIVTPITITQGTKYWVAFLVPKQHKTMMFQNDKTSGNCVSVGSFDMYTTMPTTYASPPVGTGNCMGSFYASP